MQNPLTLLTEIAEKLRAIPELEGVLIEAYDQEDAVYRSSDEAINNIPYSTGILVLYEGGELPRDGQTKGVRHSFVLVLKCQSNVSIGDSPGYFDLITRIYDGVPIEPAGDGYWKFIDSELTNCEPITNIEHRQESSQDGITYWTIRFTVTEK